MISILIPTYNYNVYPLVREVHKQFTKSGADFEILVYDDASDKSFENNELINELSNAHYHKLKQNIGRVAIRYKMAEAAKFNHLLFLDADVFPKDRFFATKFLKAIEQTPADVYFGGIKVPEHPLSPDTILRWKYGKERESMPLSERLKNPYKSLIFGAVGIKKEVYLTDAKTLLPFKKYGLDIYFSYILKQHQRSIHHYQNPVVHLGLEDNMSFIKKTESALETYRFLISNQLVPADYISLTKYAEKLKSLKLQPVCKMIFPMLRLLLLNNLKGQHPSLFLFDVYKLLYYCRLK
jgi:glycosyltransferase involved in cell wall biosynthesis